MPANACIFVRSRRGKIEINRGRGLKKETKINSKMAATAFPFKSPRRIYGRRRGRNGNKINKKQNNLFQYIPGNDARETSAVQAMTKTNCETF